jgi:hypothetical protein
MQYNIKSRSPGRDISELFGYSPDDRSKVALSVKLQRSCPFVGGKCTKTNHDKSVVYGVCSVSDGVKSSDNDVIICPKRLYANKYSCLKRIADEVWGLCQNRGFILGGTYESLRTKALRFSSSVVAFGQGSGKEVGFSSGGALSVDWVLQRYERTVHGALVAKDFICVEIQSIDTTNNYRKAWEAYMSMNEESVQYNVPVSDHGLNWANVHKRLIPQLIRKGNVMLHAPRCLGLYFVLPDAVFKKFEEILPSLNRQQSRPKKGSLTVHTYVLGKLPMPGEIRPISLCRTSHFKLEDVALAFIAPSEPQLGAEVDRQVELLL